MTRQNNTNAVAKILVCALALFVGTMSVGCDEYGWVDAGDFYTPDVAAGDFYEPTVEPADFSPYGYDYDMYDIFTEDI